MSPTGKPGEDQPKKPAIQRRIIFIKRALQMKYVLLVFLSGFMVGVVSYRLYSAKSVAATQPTAPTRMKPEEWRRHVNPEDLPTIVRARRRQFVFALSFVLLTHLIAASAYLNVVAQLYCCQIADLSRPDPALQSRGRSRRQVIRRTEAVFATDRGRDGLLFSRWGSGQEQGRGEAW